MFKIKTDPRFQTHIRPIVGCKTLLGKKLNPKSYHFGKNYSSLVTTARKTKRKFELGNGRFQWQISFIPSTRYSNRFEKPSSYLKHIRSSILVAFWAARTATNKKVLPTTRYAIKFRNWRYFLNCCWTISLVLQMHGARAATTIFDMLYKIW